jgi:hypothetical protein
MSQEHFSAEQQFTTAEHVRRTLSVLMPELARMWTLPLADYAYTVYDDVVRGETDIRQHAMARLQKTIEAAAIRAGFCQIDAQDASRQVAQFPVIQTGPHCHLLIEPDAYYTHVFSALGLSAHARRWHLCYSCSTVKFTEKSRKGPGWLTVGHEPVNVFGLSRSRMDPHSVCGFNGPYRFELITPKGANASSNAVTQLKAVLPDGVFPSAAEAIKAANQALWQKAFPASLSVLQLDDIDIADLVADHLEDQGSWLSSRFTDILSFPESILRAIEKLNSGTWAGWVRRTTDLFWGLQDGRIFPLRLERGVLSGESRWKFEVCLDPESIATALRQRKLVPNLLMTFLVTSILPGVRVLGGCRQTIYYPLMRHIVATALESAGDLKILEAMRADVMPGMWGHRVLRPKHGSPLMEIEEQGFAGGTAKYAACSLMDSAGDMVSFTSDPIWAQISADISDNKIHRGSVEWQWA